MRVFFNAGPWDGVQFELPDGTPVPDKILFKRQKTDGIENVEGDPMRLEIVNLRNQEELYILDAPHFHERDEVRFDYCADKHGKDWTE